MVSFFSPNPFPVTIHRHFHISFNRFGRNYIFKEAVNVSYCM